MKDKKKKKRWLACLGMGACCLIVLLMMNADVPSPADDTVQQTTRRHADLTSVIRTANQSSTGAYTREADAWRQYVRSARSPQNLRAFVDELTGLEQKYKSGLSWFDAESSDEERAQALFRKHVLDERQLAAEMQATIDAYEQVLCEQDQQVYEAVGMSREEWASRIRLAKPNAAAWAQAVEPVITRAVQEARQDVARFAATWVASDLAGDGIKQAARSAGWDKSEVGSLDDLISGFAIDIAAGIVIESMTDPTDSIVEALSEEMARAEYELLDGEQGLLTVMRRLKAAHESARSSLLTETQGR